MAEYVVRYEMCQGSKSATGSKTCKCESETTAIRLAEDQGKKQYPNYDFVLKEVKRR